MTSTHGNSSLPKADAIVVAWRSSKVIRRCVASLREDPAVDRIVVVNNSPEDPLDQTFVGVERVTLLRPESNLGFGSGVNLARPHVTQPFVVLANPDAVQSDNTASRIIGFLQEHPEAAMVGPRMVQLDGSLYLNSHHDLSLWRMVGGLLHPKLGPRRSPEEHGRAHIADYVIGAWLVARVASLDVVDWFDPSIFLFGEDQDLCRRLRREGWEIWYAPLGRVEHASGHSWRQDPTTAERLFREARYRELRKMRGKASAYAYLALKWIADHLIRPLIRLLRPRRSP